MSSRDNDETTATGRRQAAPKVSVVVPCHNEEGNLPALFERVPEACRPVVGDDFEIVLVDDGSSDSTWPMIVEAGARDGRIVGVRLSRNFGHQIALTAGLDNCRGEWVLVIDGDLQDPPELLGDMMELAKGGADVVYGKRRARTGDSVARKFASAVFYRLLRHLADVDIPVDTGDFRLMSRRVHQALRNMPEQHRYIRGMVSWIGFKQVPFIYDRDPRVAGTTGYSFSRLISFSIDAILGFSEKPLRVAIFSGLAFGALGVLTFMYLVYAWLTVGSPVAGWTSLMATLCLLFGLNLTFLGLIGEYIGRIFLQSKGRPLYFVAERIADAVHEEPLDIVLSGGVHEPGRRGHQ